MNKARRQELNDVAFLLDDAADRLMEIKDDEQDSYDNLPEGLQCSRTGDSMLEAMDQMDEIYDAINNVKEMVYDMAANKKTK